MLCNFAPATLSQFAIQVDTAVLRALDGGKSINCCKVILFQKTQVQFESVSMSDCQQSLHHEPKSHDFMQNKATQMDHYQITLIKLDILMV